VPSTTADDRCNASSGGASGQFPSILTTHNKGLHPAWTSRTVLFREYYEAQKRIAPGDFGFLDSYRWAWRLFRLSVNYDAVVTGSEHVGHIFALLQAFFRTRRRRVPHVMIDFPWAAAPGAFTMFLKRIQMKIESRSIYRIFAHAGPEEAERFARTLRVREDLFRFVPYHSTLSTPPPKASSGDYVFSGGWVGRDYPTLLRALAGLPNRCIVCSPHNLSDTMAVPQNVDVMKVDPARFDEWMAGSRAVVIALPAGHIHTGGHTVIANALTFGKPVIVAGSSEYRHYIDDGVDGLIVPAGNSDKLRDAILRVCRDDAFAAELANNALRAAPRFSRETFFQVVYDTVDAALRERGSSRLLKGRHS